MSVFTKSNNFIFFPQLTIHLYFLILFEKVLKHANRHEYNIKYYILLIQGGTNIPELFGRARSFSALFDVTPA